MVWQRAMWNTLWISATSCIKTLSVTIPIISYLQMKILVKQCIFVFSEAAQTLPNFPVGNRRSHIVLGCLWELYLSLVLLHSFLIISCKKKGSVSTKWNYSMWKPTFLMTYVKPAKWLNHPEGEVEWGSHSGQGRQLSRTFLSTPNTYKILNLWCQSTLCSTNILFVSVQECQPIQEKPYARIPPCKSLAFTQQYNILTNERYDGHSPSSLPMLHVADNTMILVQLKHVS